MNQDWQNFLSQHGAQFLDGTVQHFGNLQKELVASRDGNILCDLAQFGTIKVSGEEAQKFLQSLLSNDITAVSNQTAQLSSFNSPKGRMLASFIIWQQGSDYYLQLPRELTPAMHKKLSMYVLRAKVTVSDVSDHLVCFGVAGKNAGNLIKKIGELPDKDWMMTQKNELSILRLSADRFQIYTAPAYAISLWSELSTDTQPVGSTCWNWLNIHAGIPVITLATQEQFVLQMANLDILGGVSFTKGCYPGQEIVARTHYLGKQKRRMYLAHVESDIAPAAGNEIFSTEMPGQACGMIINSAPAPVSGYDLLVVMQIASHQSDNVHLNSLDGGKLNFLALPYNLPASD